MNCFFLAHASQLCFGPASLILALGELDLLLWPVSALCICLKRFILVLLGYICSFREIRHINTGEAVGLTGCWQMAQAVFVFVLFVYFHGWASFYTFNVTLFPAPSRGWLASSTVA